MEEPLRTLDASTIADGLQTVSGRLARVLESTVTEHLPAHDAQVVLQELATALEEARVAEEELIVQAEQLAASAAMVDAERERYAELFEFVPDAYLETDEFGKILLANGAAEAMLGLVSRFLIGKLLHVFLPEHSRRDFRRMILDLRRSHEPLTFEIDVKPRHRDALRAEVRAAARMSLTADGDEHLRIRWMLRDITERIKLESEIEQLHADVGLLAALADVNRLVQGATDPMRSMLDGLVALAQQLAGDSEAGIMLGNPRGAIDICATSGAGALAVSDVEQVVHGPALRTLQDGLSRQYAADDVEGEWPQLATKLREHGFAWARAHPVHTDGAPAVFTVYGRGEVPVDLDRSLTLLTQNAAGIIKNGELYRTATVLTSQLTTALESRGIIEQAKGVLMALQGCGPDEAFAILRSTSQRQNRKLRVVSEELVSQAQGSGRRER